MKKCKRVLSVVLALILAVTATVIPVAAAGKNDVRNDPIVFVHGLMGWGDRADINKAVPYWGMSTGSLTKFLNAQGYETYAATVGPLSSAWDRACELYAQMTGTTVDYGEAHSNEKGHARYGITYDKPLFEGWGEDKKVNLVGHSFGGATTRLFLEVLANGSKEEVAAAKKAGTKVSPFFEGGKGSWVHSLTALAAPHNGTTFIECCPRTTEGVSKFVFDVGAALGLTKYKGFYDLQLEQFGIKQQDGETFEQALKRMFNSDFMQHNDNAIYDLMIDNAIKINDGIEMQDNVYYFSIAGRKTHYSSEYNKEVPDDGMFAPFKIFSKRMCEYIDKYTVGGVYITKDWIPNDGMVNVISGLYPFDSNLKAVKANGQPTYKIYDGVSLTTFKPGVWNVMPTAPYDHMGMVGGMMTNSVTETRLMYLNIVQKIYGTYGGAYTYKDHVIPFSDSKELHWAFDLIYFIKQHLAK